jgi:hypothetical protein
MKDDGELNKLNNSRVRSPIKNYVNYTLGTKGVKQVKKQVLKTRMKRYNDPSEHSINEIYDVFLYLMTLEKL